MISQPKNRVQAIKSKFESLSNENAPLIVKKKIAKVSSEQLCKQSNGEPVDIDRKDELNAGNNCHNKENFDRRRDLSIHYRKISGNDSDGERGSPKPNVSYLYNKTDIKRSASDTKNSLIRQTSDPGKKLHRSHAFRCDRSQKINDTPKRHGSCNGRSETSDFSLKMGERKLSKERLKRLGNLLEDQMRKENFISLKNDDNEVVVGKVCEVPVIFHSVPDKDVPQHILDQYAKINKIKKNEIENKQDPMTDSGVSSETENLEEEKNGKIQKLKLQFEKTENIPSTKANLESMDELCGSSETMRLERKNPHLVLTDTLKKALKQPLPPGPPPQKPPRTINLITIPETCQKKDTKQMLQKLEQVLQKREAQNSIKNIYDIAEFDQSPKRPKEIHYLCTEILDIAQRTLLPDQDMSKSNCFNPLKCAMVSNSTMSLPYTRLNSDNYNHNSMKFCCSCSNENLEKDKKSTLMTFLTDKKCPKCRLNAEKHETFKCHLDCQCKIKNSEFYVDEHIYDVPFTGESGDSEGTKPKGGKLNSYGALNSWKLKDNHSKSLEDLRLNKNLLEDQIIYDIPCDVSRPPTPDFITSSPKTDFQRLRSNFEISSRDGDNAVHKNIKVSKSTENLSAHYRMAKMNVEKKFATDRKYKKFEKNPESATVMKSLKKNNSQLDVDRENLNRLMNEIYDTVTAACNMDDNKPGSFPTEHSDGSTSEESVKVTRSLTEKRKNYVRRVSSRVAYLDTKSLKSTRFRHPTSICSYKSDITDNKQYSTFRSWKSFRASQSQINLQSPGKRAEEMPISDSKFNLTDSSGNVFKEDFSISTDTIDNMSLDGKAGCVDIELPFEPRERGLFNVCLLVGLDYMSGQAYVKTVFPSQVQVPPHIENLIFPETLSAASKGEWSADCRGGQCYSIVLTDERGERSYGYCRRVLPEAASVCLPLCYCIIGKYRAPGFYYKVLQEIESHHGCSEVEINSILQQLFEIDFPSPGEEITISYRHHRALVVDETHRHSASLDDLLKSKTMPDLRNEKREMFEREAASLERDAFLGKSESSNIKYSDYYDLENNNDLKRYGCVDKERTKTIKRPLEPRVDEDNLSTLVDLMGAGLLLKVFGSLLLERKVIIVSDQLSDVSSCMEALQSSLYPFVWQQPLISVIPAEIRRSVLEAPLPILAGMLRTPSDNLLQAGVPEEGMLIDLTHPSKLICYQGDEASILPTSNYKTLKTSLQMESIKNRQEDKMTRNVLISEAFLRFFVDILGDFWRFFMVGELKDGYLGKGDIVFDKENFIKNASSKQNQYFLEWFTETAMFNHFIQNMAAVHNARRKSPSTSDIDPPLVDTPLPKFYDLFEERARNRSKTSCQKNIESKSNYKNALNRRVRLFKAKLRDLIT